MNVIPRESLTADNWDQIWCDGICYFSAPAGDNRNSIDDPDCFTEDGTFENQYIGGMPRYDYRRRKVGDAFNGLYIQSAMTVFSRTDEHALGVSGGRELAAADKLYISSVVFAGETELDAYLVVSGGQLFCIPLNGEMRLPVMFPISDQTGSGYSSGHIETTLAPAGGSVSYRSELPPIRLQNGGGIDLTEYLGSDGYAKVTLTLDNVSMSYSRDMSCITANVKSVRTLAY